MGEQIEAGHRCPFKLARGIVLVTAFMVTACAPAADNAILACEAFIKDRLRSPSTYQQISARSIVTVDRSEVIATVEYDAANAYGVPIRDKEYCSFATKAGQVPPLEDLEHEARMAAIGDGPCCTGGSELPVDLNASASEILNAVDAELANSGPEE